ncbi:MAG: O-antigen ligase family protein [Vicinamibacterales bacterium]
MPKSSERLLIAALAWGALSFGAVYPWAYWPLAVACAAVGIQAAIVSRAWQDPRARALGIALGAVALAIGLQLVTLPYSLLGRLSPAVDRFLRDYEIAYHPASVHALSIAPMSTLVVLGLFVAFALLLIGLSTGLRYMSLEWLVTQVMGLGVALVLIGVVQKAFPVDDANSPLVYGFWQPRQGGNPFGPFVNRNHYAGWMVMALPLVAGYSCAVLSQTARFGQAGLSARLRWLTTVEASRFVLVGFSALLMGMALVLTGSRSGVASFAVATLVFGYFAMRRFRGRRSRVLVAVYLMVILGGAVAWAGPARTIDRFLIARTDAPGRLGAWQDTTRIVADFPIFGTGMGTYGRAMLVYQTHGRPRMYAQAHNDYLQILAEGGALVAIPVAATLVVIAVVLRRRLLRGTDDPPTHWIRAGAIAGLAGIATQSAVEFSLQMPGNTALFVLVLAIALHRGRGHTAPAPRPTPRHPSSPDAHRF